MKFKPRFLLMMCMIAMFFGSFAQPGYISRSLPPLPDPEGFAGMFAGVSGNELFCMGGANFPGRKPWEGGQKVWYDRIFRFKPGKGWTIMEERLPYPSGYGVSVTYEDEIIMAGGSNAAGHLRAVYGIKWDQAGIHFRSLPDLPLPLANMAGCLNGSLLILVGGTVTPTGNPQSLCIMLDLSNPHKGWFKLPDCPGPGRTQAVSGVYKGVFYLFGGETAPLDSIGIRHRRMLRDAYKFESLFDGHEWSGKWIQLDSMPRAATAAANPAPMPDGHTFLLWGGVDDEMAAHRDPRTHPGFNQDMLYYNARDERWIAGKKEIRFPSRVTLPSVAWDGSWILVSGEVRPGIRTPAVIVMKSGKKKQ